MSISGSLPAVFSPAKIIHTLSDYSEIFTWLAGGTPVNLTGCVGDLKIIDNCNNEMLTQANTIGVVSGFDNHGHFTVRISADEMPQPGVYTWILLITFNAFSTDGARTVEVWNDTVSFVL